MDDITKIESIVSTKSRKEVGDGQDYDLISIVWECRGCGAMVSNTPQHDRMHNKTRSVVD